MLAASCEHSVSGSVPAGMLLQVPTEPASAQSRQIPAQSELQQTPSRQKPEAHCTLSEQPCPLVHFFSQVVLPLQKKPGGQSVWAMQLPQ